MDKIILNNGTTLDIDSIITITNGLALTFKNQTIETLENLMAKPNLSTIKLTTEAGEAYAEYKNLSCLSIEKIIATGDMIVTLYIVDTTQEQLIALREQVAEMLLAMVEGGLI